jgi:hypothetical protein
MPSVYITRIDSIEISDSEVVSPRDRFVDYYNDLYRLYKNELTEGTFKEGGQHSFSQLGSQLLDICQKNINLKTLDVLVPVYWSCEFDPDYSSCGTYLHNKYQLDCDLFDIFDQGTLASYTGVHILQQYLLCGKYNKGMLIALEQTTIPRNVNDHDVIPTRNGACALMMQSIDDVKRLDSTYPILKVIDSIIFDSSQLYLTMKTSLDVVLESLSQYGISQNKTCIATRKNSSVWKRLRIQANQNNSDFASFAHYSSECSMLSTLIFLHELLLQVEYSYFKYLLLVDEDVESLNVGILLLEIIDTDKS